MIGILDYGVGNVSSIQNMFRHIGVDAEPCGYESELDYFERFVLPGVGAFDSGMMALRSSGLISPLIERVRAGQPLLGICLGMQMLAEGSEEGGEPGLGLVPGLVRRFRFAPEKRMRVPHMGWNQVSPSGAASLFDEGLGGLRFYFVHAFHFEPRDAGDAAAMCVYGVPFVAAIERGNVFGVQFHPEKSHRFGMSVLRRFGEV